MRVSHTCVRCFFSHWSLSDSKSPQISWTLLSILDYLNNAVAWVVLTCPVTSKSSSSFTNLFRIIPSTPITTGITVTFMFHNFFSSLTRSWYLSLFGFFWLYSAVYRGGKGQVLGCAYTTCSYGWSNLNFLHNSQWIPPPTTSRV